MRVDDRVMAILAKWLIAEQADIDYVKLSLLPDAEPQDVKLKVTEHPNMRGSDIYIAWYDIDVLYDGFVLGHIILNTNNNEALYYF